MGQWVFLVLIMVSVIFFVVWQTAVYECKLEYVFSSVWNMEGYVVGADRITMSLSQVIFIATLAPEFTGSAFKTFFYGAIIMVAGCLPTLLVQGKHAYMRMQCDMDSGDRHNMAEESGRKGIPADLFGSFSTKKPSGPITVPNEKIQIT